MDESRVLFQLGKNVFDFLKLEKFVIKLLPMNSLDIVKIPLLPEQRYCNQFFFSNLKFGIRIPADEIFF